jgi:hypothetical protein
MEITFASEGAKKLSGRKGDVLYRSVPALREILEKGPLTKTSPETKGRSHIKAWHAISATVMLDDMPRDLVAHVMETQDENFQYDLSRDMSDGARFLREGADTSITAGRYGLEDNPVDLTLDFAKHKIKPEAVPVTGLKALALALALVSAAEAKAEAEAEAAVRQSHPKRRAYSAAHIRCSNAKLSSRSRRYVCHRIRFGFGGNGATMPSFVCPRRSRSRMAFVICRTRGVCNSTL